MAACGVSLQRTITTSSGNVAQIGFLNNLLQKLRPIILRKGIEVGAECLLRPIVLCTAGISSLCAAGILGICVHWCQRCSFGMTVSCTG